MKTNQPRGSHLRLGLCLAVLAMLAACSSPSPFFKSSKWPLVRDWGSGGFAYDVKVVGNYVYVANGVAGLQVIDVSNPTNCVRVGGYDIRRAARGVAISGSYAYVADESGGFQVIDVRNPTNCVRVGGCATRGVSFVTKLAVSGNYAYMPSGAGLQVIDVSDPANCVRVGGYDSGRYAPDVYGRDVAVSGNYAYVANGDTGLLVIDVRNPTNCARAGGYDTSGFARGVVVSGNYAYVADDTEGLQVIDVSNPTNCVRVGGCETRRATWRLTDVNFRGTARGVAVSGNYAYVVSGEAGLEVIDVRNPANCVRAGRYITRGSAVGVAASGNYAYVADFDEGLQVIDVRNPAKAVRVGGYVPLKGER